MFPDALRVDGPVQLLGHLLQTAPELIRGGFIYSIRGAEVDARRTSLASKR